MRGGLGVKILQRTLILTVICAAWDLHMSPHLRRAKNTLTIRAVAHEWWWEFEYPASGIRTKNELHLPVSSNIEFELVSGDVLHSFWMQGMNQPVEVVLRQNRNAASGDEPCG